MMYLIECVERSFLECKTCVAIMHRDQYKDSLKAFMYFGFTPVCFPQYQLSSCYIFLGYELY